MVSDLHPDTQADRQAPVRRARSQSGSKAYWFKVDEKGELAGGIAKFVTDLQAPAGAGADAWQPNTLRGGGRR